MTHAPAFLPEQSRASSSFQSVLDGKIVERVVGRVLYPTSSTPSCQRNPIGRAQISRMLRVGSSSRGLMYVAGASLAAAAALACTIAIWRREWHTMRRWMTREAVGPFRERELLIMVCSPKGKAATTNLALEAADSEAAAISRHMPAVYFRGGTASDLRDALLGEATRRFVFIGHGGLALLPGHRATLGFTTPEGTIASVHVGTLAALLGECAPPAGYLELVVLQGCCTLELGRAVHAAGVPFVICWATPTEDTACRLFSTAFFEYYCARGQRQPPPRSVGANSHRYRQAFEHAANAVTLLTRPGKANAMGGIAFEVPKYELRCPSLPACDSFTPPPWAAGCPVLIYGGGKQLVRGRVAAVSIDERGAE